MLQKLGVELTIADPAQREVSDFFAGTQRP
jgi:hypothetical protein